VRILVLVHEYPPMGGGGGRVAQDICRGLVQRGHIVEVLTAHSKDLPLIEDDQGVVVRRLKSGRKLLYTAGLRAMSGYVAAATIHGILALKRFKPDIIHVHFAVPGGAVAWALSVLSGIPYVLTAHLGDVPGGAPEKTGKWFRWIDPLTPPIWKKAARALAVGEFTRQLAAERYGLPVEVIPNGVDLTQLDPGDIRVNYPPRLVFAGRFMAQKNPLQIVHTLAVLKDLAWDCVMLGDGVLRPKVEAEIAAAGLQKRIHLPGWVKPEEVITELARSDILFMPSLSEGMPVVGVQALALGLALVVSNVSGWVGMVEEGVNGVLFDPALPQRAEEPLRALLSDPVRLLAARQASRRMAHKYDLLKVVAAYEQVFSEVLHSN
jgi:glycosyltransferase involved in cell wall biosynthesis